MHPEDIISNPDLESVYEIPLVLIRAGIGKRILHKFNLPQHEPDIKEWKKFVEKVKSKKRKP